jgi:hypothetical protein
MKPLENPYLLKDLDKGLDPFLSDLTDLEPLTLVKTGSAPALLMLFEGTSKTEKDPQMMMIMTSEAMDLLTMEEEEDLLTKTPMVTCRTMFPSPQPLKSEPWDPYPESLMETELRLMPSSLNSWDT